MEQYLKLIEELNNATKAYDEGNPTMSDLEWDKKYYQVVDWEKVHKTCSPDSPTQRIDYQVVNELVKVEHTSPMLSLDKTKSLEELNQFMGNRVCFLSLKLDGLTCRLTYAGGRLVRAETRGNGIIGEDITHNARVIPSIPNRLKVPVDLVIDGEIICLKHHFEPFEKEYKNSRNFAAGSIRLLDAKECANRNLTFIAWEVIEGMEEDNCSTFDNKLLNLTSYGAFWIVPFLYAPPANPINQNMIDYLVELAKSQGIPIDGLVLKYCDIEYGRSLGATAHHWRNGIAFKFFDESYPSVLRDIEWGMGRTGQLTPVAIFDPIDIEGATVSRASLHNISILHDTLHGPGWKGQNIRIVKRNMIIPQIDWAEENEDLPQVSHQFFVSPRSCPFCGEATKIRSENETKVLYCVNEDCSCRLINRLDHFCSKDKGLDIRGLSKATLEKLIDWGWVNSIFDIYRLEKYRNDWVKQPGFGPVSVDKILAAIQASKTPTLNAFICSLGIPLIGRTISKQLLDIVSSYEDLREKVNNGYDFSQHNGFGYEKSKALLDFDYEEADQLYKLMTIQTPTEEITENKLTGASFCITGKLNRVKNREELVAIIEQNGGRFVKSVSKKVQYLINNDNKSTSAKNKEAQALGIPIITEEEFFKMI